MPRCPCNHYGMAGARATEVLAQLIDNYLAEAPQLLQAMRAAVATKMQHTPLLTR